MPVKRERSAMMDEVTRSNPKPSMPSESRSILQEQALAAWRFQPCNTAKNQDANSARIFQASQWGMEIVIKALVRQLNSKLDEDALIRTSSSSMSSEDLGSPSRAAVESKASLEVLDFKASQFEIPGIRIPPAEALPSCCNSQRSLPALNNFIGKKRPRRGKRAPITIVRANPANFQAMVQQMTGFPPENSGSKAAPSLLKPEPKRPGPIGSNIIPCAGFPPENSSRAGLSLLKPQPKRPGPIGSNIIPSALPTLDSSSFIIPSTLPALDSSSLGLPVPVNAVFDTDPNYLHLAAFCNNLTEHSVSSDDTATSSSFDNSIGIENAYALQSQINVDNDYNLQSLINADNAYTLQGQMNAFSQRDFWN